MCTASSAPVPLVTRPGYFGRDLIGYSPILVGVLPKTVDGLEVLAFGEAVQVDFVEQREAIRARIVRSLGGVL